MVTAANSFCQAAGCSKVKTEFGHLRTLCYHKQQVSDMGGAARRRFWTSPNIALIGGEIERGWSLGKPCVGDSCLKPCLG